MTQETDAHEGGAEGAVAPEAVETPSATTAEQPTGTETPEAADDAGEATEEPVKKVPWFQKRIDEVTAQKYEAQRQAEYYKGLAEGRTAQPQAEAPRDGPPQLEQFDTFEEFERANIRYELKQELAAERQQEKQRAALTTYQEREAAVRASKPDFDSVALNPRLPSLRQWPRRSTRATSARKCSTTWVPTRRKPRASPRCRFLAKPPNWDVSRPL
jgi:hypothetical protein